MCGIIGVLLLDNSNLINLILNGLSQLQNRGYDSAGICYIHNNKFYNYKYASTNKLSAIEKLKNAEFKYSENCFIGIGHNRWATHGSKTDENAHPHISNSEKFVIVHNGIIENYKKIKEQLLNEGYFFKSQTDTEIIVNLLDFNYKIYDDVYEAIKKTINSLNGTYGLIIQSTIEPDNLYCISNGSPLLIGQTDDKIIISSEQSGFSGLIKNYITLHNDDICCITRTKDPLNFTIKTRQNYKKNSVFLNNFDNSPDPFLHWTLKEIYQQSETVLNAINKGGRIKNDSEVKLGGLEGKSEILKTIDNVIILGCGTSYFAGLYGAFYLKNICNFNTVQVFDGADFNEYDVPKSGNTALILISQSGETKDLHRCLEISKFLNLTTIGIVNVVDSLIAREVDCGIYCNAGKEVAVASTKSFVSQVVCLSMLAIWFATIQNVNKQKRIKMISDLHNLSNDIQMSLEISSNVILQIAKKIKTNNMFILGKGSDEFIAKEGALKIKEISYIHSEGYSSSSLKHGPFALLDENFPVIILNLDQLHYFKTMNCYQEILSRNAPILLITNDPLICNEVSGEQIILPVNNSYASLLGIIPIQMLAYYLSIEKGINPDKPKNLAKVVTVE